MASFTIYDMGSAGNPKNLGEEDAVEMGLSPGELRQSLLDRLREEIEERHVVKVNNCLCDFDLFLVEKHLRTKKGRMQAEKDVEDVLYAADDAQFANTVWTFTGERIYVAEEDD